MLCEGEKERRKEEGVRAEVYVFDGIGKGICGGFFFGLVWFGWMEGT